MRFMNPKIKNRLVISTTINLIKFLEIYFQSDVYPTRDKYLNISLIKFLENYFTARM